MFFSMLMPIASMAFGFMPSPPIPKNPLSILAQAACHAKGIACDAHHTVSVRPFICPIKGQDYLGGTGTNGK